MRLRRLPITLAFALLTLLPLAAAERYLPHFPAVELLPPPPTPGSAEERAELDFTYRLHTNATPQELALAHAENRLTPFQLTDGIVPWFQPGKAPKTEALLQRVELEAKAITDEAKNHWKHPRPYHEDPARFPHSVEHESNEHYSYPSGHSTRGTLFAAVLGELFPEQRDAIYAKGREAGWLRILGGVHFPSDVYAGRVLGQAIARELLADAGFRHELADARAELAVLRPR